MKKIIVSTFLLASLVACYKDDVILEEIQQEPLSKAKDYLSGDERVKMKRHKITPERAMLIAEDAKELFADENRIKTRSATVALFPVAITSHPKTRSAGGTDTLMYVVNYSNGNGFVFVSNDDRDGDILMYSSGGNFQMKDTTDNPGLKLHVELMLAYQEHKLKEMRTAEANGEVYMGSMTTEEVSIDECLPNIMASTKGVVPGLPGGLPGHTCNVTGQPGMPGAAVTRKDICAPATYVSKDWEGHTDAIDLAQNKYRNQKCFGVPVLPPEVKFTTQGAPGVGGSHQNCFPYCSPHIRDYKGYYENYGAKMRMHLKTVRSENIQVPPLLKTYWDQGSPLDYGVPNCILGSLWPFHSNCSRPPAGCAPIALGQIMTYHKHPQNIIYGLDLAVLETKKTNEDITNAGLGVLAGKFIINIANHLGVTYSCKGSGVLSLSTGTKDIQNTFKAFGYSIGYNGAWNYQDEDNFWRVKQSIVDRQPIFIYGFPQGGGGLKYFDGHTWVLDGYKVVIDKYYYADYYFDEYGKFNAENKYMEQIKSEYIHANMGWASSGEDIWVVRGAYHDWDDDDYCGKLYYIAGIKPNR